VSFKNYNVFILKCLKDRIFALAIEHIYNHSKAIQV